MKADLFVQGNFWATIIVPGDSLLALLAKGILDEANHKCQQLTADLPDLTQVLCSINLRFRDPVTYDPTPGD